MKLYAVIRQADEEVNSYVEVIIRASNYSEAKKIVRDYTLINYDYTLLELALDGEADIIYHDVAV